MNEIERARISMMARSSKAPSIGRIQMRKTNLPQIIIFGLQRAAGPYRWAIFDRCIAARAEGELIVAFSAAQRGSVGKWPHDTKPEVGFTVRRVRSETTRG